MTEGKVALVVLCLLLFLAGSLGGGFLSFAAVTAMAVQEESPPIPPEYEAAYRQVGQQTGVNWAVLAAWDGAANRFILPIPTVDQIFSDKVEEALDRKRRAAEQWCEDHPKDEERCPPEPPSLSPQEEQALWRSAYTAWRARLTEYITAHAAALQPYLADLDREPEVVYRRFLASAQAAKAAEFLEGYLILDTMTDDSDAILLPPTQPPADWVPVNGFAWPAMAPITSRYGMRISPIDGVQRLHAGIDLGVETGTPIRATKAGRVVAAEWSDVYGNVVIVDHGGGYSSLYAHNSALAVRVGQDVAQGQVISYSGSTGWSTGPHLHFEIHYQGAPIDPLLVLTDRTERG